MSVDRLKMCNICEFNVGGECALCGCNIEQKVADPNENCPAVPPRWLSSNFVGQSTSVPQKGAPHPNTGCGSCTKRK